MAWRSHGAHIQGQALLPSRGQVQISLRLEVLLPLPLPTGPVSWMGAMTVSSSWVTTQPWPGTETPCSGLALPAGRRLTLGCCSLGVKYAEAKQ